MKKLLFLLLCLPFLLGWSSDTGWDNPNTQVVGTELSVYTYYNNVTDDGSFNLPTSTDGLGVIKSGTTDLLSISAIFSVDKNGNTLLGTTSDSLSNHDEDGNLCIFDAGEGYATIKNRIGTTQNVKVIYYFQKE